MVYSTKYFHDESESKFLLEEAMRFIVDQCANEDGVIRDMAQAQSTKIAAAFIRLDQGADAIAALQSVSLYWTAEKEERYKDMWMPVIARTYATGHASTALQMLAVMKSKKDAPTGDWVESAYLQCLLRLIEKGEQMDMKNIVDTWWKIFEDQGRPVPASVMVLLLESQVKRGEKDRVRATLEGMKKHGLQVTSDAWLKAFWPSLRGRRDTEMFDLLISYTENVQEVVDGLARHFAEKKKLRECFRVLSRFGVPIGSRQPDIAKKIASVSLPICTAMATIFSRKEQPDRALRFLDLAIDNRCEGTYTPLFQELCFALFKTKRHLDVFLLGAQLLQMPHDNIFSDGVQRLPLKNITSLLAPTHRKYSTILSAVSHFEDTSTIVPATRAILLDMFSHQVNVSNKVRRSLAKIVERLGKNASVVRLREYVQDPLKVEEGAISLTDDHVSEWNKFVDVLHSEAVVDSFKVGLWRRSPAKYEEADREGRVQLDDFKFLTPISNLAEMEQQADRAIMAPTHVYVAPSDLDSSMPLTSAGYAIRLKVFAVIRRDFDAAKKIYHSMLEEGIEVTKYHLSSLIEGLALLDKTEEAHHLWREATTRMPDLNLSDIFYTSLVRGYEERQDWTAILSVATEMENKKIEVSRQLDMSFRAIRSLLREERAGIVVTSRSDLIDDEKRYGLLREETPEVKKVRDVDDLVRDLLHFQNTRQFLTAQRVVATALDDKGGGSDIVANARLRKSLNRCDNYLRKQLKQASSIGSGNPRHVRHLTQALELCRENRAKVKGNPEQLQELNKRLHEESKQRHALFLLLRDALASDTLRDEATARRKEREKEAARAGAEAEAEATEVDTAL